MKNIVYYAEIALYFIVSSHLYGQKLTPQVISSAGASASGDGVQLSWTLGEPVVSTFITSNNILTQGFHQGKLEVTAINIPAYPELELSVYPYPVSTTMKLDVKGELIKNLSLRLFTIDGKILPDKQIETLPEMVDIEQFADGAYLLKIYRDIEEPLRTFRIIKE